MHFSCFKLNNSVVWIGEIGTFLTPRHRSHQSEIRRKSKTQKQISKKLCLLKRVKDLKMVGFISFTFISDFDGIGHLNKREWRWTKLRAKIHFICWQRRPRWWRLSRTWNSFRFVVCADPRLFESWTCDCFTSGVLNHWFVGACAPNIRSDNVLKAARVAPKSIWSGFNVLPVMFWCSHFACYCHVRSVSFPVGPLRLTISTMVSCARDAIHRNKFLIEFRSLSVSRLAFFIYFVMCIPFWSFFLRVPLRIFSKQTLWPAFFVWLWDWHICFFCIRIFHYKFFLS